MKSSSHHDEMFFLVPVYRIIDYRKLLSVVFIKYRIFLTRMPQKNNCFSFFIWLKKYWCKKLWRKLPVRKRLIRINYNNIRDLFVTVTNSYTSLTYVFIHAHYVRLFCKTLDLMMENWLCNLLFQNCTMKRRKILNSFLWIHFR